MSRGVPTRGDILALSLDPTKGHEIRGTRPVLVLSADAFNKALEADPQSAFGGIVAIDGTLDVELARLIAAQVGARPCASMMIRLVCGKISSTSGFR